MQGVKWIPRGNIITMIIITTIINNHITNATNICNVTIITTITTTNHINNVLTKVQHRVATGRNSPGNTVTRRYNVTYVKIGYYEHRCRTIMYDPP